jgi:hypothetical protein
VYGPFFFMETTITGIVYLDMLQEFLIPQLDEDDQEMLRSVWQETDYRWDVCRITNGSHIEP